MDILLTGNLKQLSNAMLSRLEEDYKCVIFGENQKEALHGKNIISFLNEDVSRVYSTYNFDTVIFFSYALDGAVKVFDELEKLESTIHDCKKYQIKNFIYITTNDLVESETREDISNSSRYILMHACEKLCDVFSQNHVMKFTILRIPYLYNMNCAGNQLYTWLEDAITKQKIVMRTSDYQETDFLCDEDLGELLSRILDEPEHEWYQVMNLSGNNPVLFRELEKQFKDLQPNLEVTYTNDTQCIPEYKKDVLARTEYGWYPKHVLQDDIKVLYEALAGNRKKKKTSYERRIRYKKVKEKLRILLEIAVVFALAEGLNYWTGDNVMINFLDFRLIFVVLMGTMNGLNAGVVAALLASIGYVVDKSGTTQWQILFYNVENWLPFACYFLLGTISGYTRDKHDDEVVYIREEEEILEKKYIFLSELYNRILENKDSFNSQIIGYKDSFGKLYSIVKKLDSTLPDEVFYEAVSVLEEMMDNTSIAIYTINGQSDFARLNVCSKNISQELSKSMKLSDYAEVKEALQKNEIFVNTQCLEGYPSYVMPIYRKDELMGMILLMRAQNNQMTMEYSNKFSIIADLTRDSLIRAMQFNDMEDFYIDGTSILRKEKFQEVLSVKEQMKEKQYMDYILLKVLSEHASLQELSNQISSLVRTNDVLGQGEDGEIYLLLSQTRHNDLSVISERLKNNNITFSVVKG